MRSSISFAGRLALRTASILPLAAIATVALGCGQAPAEIGTVQIEPIQVSGPPAGWDMSTRLMNRQSASSATLSARNGGASAGFERISGSMYLNEDAPEPFTGTVVMRTDSLAGSDAALLGQLQEWLEPARYPAFIFQSTGSRLGEEGVAVEGNLFLRDQVIPATSTWRAVQPVVPGEDLRKSGELVATIDAVVPGAPFPGGELRLELRMPVVGYTAAFVENMLTNNGFDVANLAGPDPTYPDDPGDLSNIAWYLMLAGHTDRALEVFQMSLDRDASLNTYLRRSDGYVFDGQYSMAVGSYTALEPYNVGQPHGLELVKILGGHALDTAKVAEINRALTGGS